MSDQRLTPEREWWLRTMYATKEVNEVCNELDRRIVELERSDAARTITDAMVDRAGASIAYTTHGYEWPKMSESHRDHYRTLARRALTAAMAKDGGA